MDPQTLRFATTHEWVAVDGDTATIGISKFAVDQLTDLVYIELPEPGTTFEKGDEFGVVESVKAASDLYAPISGEVVEANTALEEDQSALSDDPYGDGWILKVKISSQDEIEQLLDHAAYQQHCESESH
ncbi:glycine cleavage system protein GcvH [Thalassoroseus pseudoceratinae]|uniref:glycine cleavage system protein GcvH n=1 Tax=Thalassoroseus pseudoceratinae TaxID=2713176 RepID=UPI001420B153|nr:glycine cleavage system protein GcvH [Thalassoroseus pseudoceratinae]